MIRALVQLGREDFVSWLADEDTRDAALATLAASPGWREQTERALEAAQHVPAAAVLAHLLGQPDGAGFEVLDAASRGWPAERKRWLWEAAAAVSALPSVRAEVWKRLARLGAAP